jgi:hypothetical protein
LLPWVIGIGLFGTGVAAIYAWYRSNQMQPPPDDGLGPDGEPLPDGGGSVEDATPGVGPGAAAAAGAAGAASAGVSDETMVNETPPAAVEPPPAEGAEPGSETRPPGEPPAQ